MKILFRVDCNNETGFGHFSRCLNLARTFTCNHVNSQILFAGNYNKFSRSLLDYYNISFECISWEKFEIIFPWPVDSYDLVFIDTYLICQDKLNSLRAISSRLVFIDDSACLDFSHFFCVINFRHNADLLFSYQSHYSFLGSQYLILKPELMEIRNQKSNYSGSFVNLLLFTGGAPLPAEHLFSLVELLSHISPETKITHIGNLTSSPPLSANYKNVIPTPDIESYLLGTDVAINTGGLFKYESSYSCVPTASFFISTLQASDSKVLAEAGLHADLGSILTFDPRKPSATFLRFVLDSDYRQSLVSSSLSTYCQNPTLNLVSSLIKLI